MISSAPAKYVDKHPPGLYLLFLTEMWERMSFYGMRALLVLYMTAAVSKNGFGWSHAHALSVYGWYTGSVYFTPLIGGYLADNYLGQRRAILLGGIIMMIGHFLMALPGETWLYVALGTLVIGNGLFKPNISTMVGELYQPGDARRDSAFIIFYMGINIGSILSPFICGTLGEKVGFDWGFASAGVGMLIGLIIYMVGNRRYLGTVGLRPVRTQPVAASVSAPSVKKSMAPIERDRLLVAIVLCLFAIFFFAAFEQAGGLLNLYTNEKVNRMVGSFEIPTTWFQALNPIFIILLGPLFSMLWERLARLGRDWPLPIKMASGLILVSFGFVFMVAAAKQSQISGLASLWWVVAAYLFHTMGELCFSPIGLSMVTKLSPKHLVGLMMGFWFFNSAIAEKTAATFGSYADRLGEAQLFGVIVLVTAASGLALMLLNKGLTKRMHGVS